MRLRVKRSPRAGGLTALLLIAVAAVGVLTGAPARGATTATASTTTHTTHTRIDQSEREDIFLTRITARLDTGPTLFFDQSFDLPFGAPTVQAAIAAAQAALLAAIDPDPAVTGPFLLASSTGLFDTLTEKTGEVFDRIEQTITVEETIGPATAWIGLERSVPFFVPGGSNNFNANTHTETFINDIFLTTDTFLTSEHYELIGFPQQVVAVPEPGSLGLFAGVLAGATVWRRTGRRVRHGCTSEIHLPVFSRTCPKYL